MTASSRQLTCRAVMQQQLTCRTIQLRADSLDEQARTVEAVMSTERPATVFDFQSFRLIDEIILAKGANLPAQAPLLNAHNRFDLDAVLGSVAGMRIESDQTIGVLRFAEGDDQADRAFNKVRQGHITDVSVGYKSDVFDDLRPGETKIVAGRKFTAGPERTLRVTTAWTLKELSLVPIGADEQAKIRADHLQQQQLHHSQSAAGGQPNPNVEFSTMNGKLKSYLHEIGLRAEATDQEAQAFLDALTGDQKTRADLIAKGAIKPVVPEPTPEPGTQRAAELVAKPAPPVDANAIRAQERERIGAIRQRADTAGDIPPEIVDRAISEGWTTERAADAFLQIMRDATVKNRAAPVSADSGQFAIHAARNHDCTIEVLTAGLLLRSDLMRLDPNASNETRQRHEQLCEQGQQFSSLSMIDICREALVIGNQRVPRERDDLIQRAMSSGTLTNIFTNIVGAQLLASYLEAPDTTGAFTRETDLPDFKTVERTRLGKTADLERLGRGDEAVHAKIGDAMESYKIARYAKQFRVDDQDIIDDRFNALRDMPSEMGAAAARLRPDLVYSIILGNPNMRDSIALFHADHSNLNTGAALTRATIQTALTDMETQTEDGVKLGIFGTNVLVPKALRFDAAQILRSVELRNTGSTDLEAGTRNPLQDENIGIIHDARLDLGVTDPTNGTVHSGSATTWYAAATGGRHTIEVGFLRGTGRRPVLRSFILTEGRWGIGWDIKHDIGAKALDWRGLHKNTA